MTPTRSRVLEYRAGADYHTSVTRVEDAMRKALRTAAISRYEVCKRTGVDQGHMSKFMSGQAGFSFETMERIADCLGVEIVVRPKRGRKGR